MRDVDLSFSVTGTFRDSRARISPLVPSGAPAGSAGAESKDGSPTSSLRIFAALAFAFAVAGCKGSDSKPAGTGASTGDGTATATAAGDGARPAATAPDAGPPDPSCRSADDCAVAPWSSATDCCGDRCGAAHAYRRDALARLERERHVGCATTTCEQAACAPAANQRVPGCVDGRCVVVELAAERACTSDKECVLSDRAPGRCCVGDCAPAVIAWHVDDLADHEAWAAKHCAASACAGLACDEGRGNRTARCVEGRCEAALR